jgi:hypothetical protein
MVDCRFVCWWLDRMSKIILVKSTLLLRQYQALPEAYEINAL